MVFACGPRYARSASALGPNPGERHLSGIRQLTDGGENAEAYFSRDGRRLIFQSTRDGRACDQQYVMNVDGTGLHRVSTGTGKTTCGFFFANDQRILFGSSHALPAGVSPEARSVEGLRLGARPFDIYTANADGSICAGSPTMASTPPRPWSRPTDSDRLHVAQGRRPRHLHDERRRHRRQALTTTPGYDGGPWWSPDGKKIVYRAWHPADSALTTYQSLLAQRLVRPNRMEIWVMNADGADQRQITQLGGANFGPFLTPDGKRSSSRRTTRIRAAATSSSTSSRSTASGLEQVTTIRSSTAFRCSAPMERSLCGRAGGRRRKAS